MAATLTSSCNLLGSQLRWLRPQFAAPAWTHGRRAGRSPAAPFPALSAAKSDEQVPSWAKPDSDEPPPWARDDGKDDSGSTPRVPYYAYLLASVVVAIAAVGSIFEYANQKPVFGVVNSDSILYAPLLGFFVFTGVPTSAFLWFKSVQAANKEAEEQDRRDGYM